MSTDVKLCPLLEFTYITNYNLFGYTKEKGGFFMSDPITTLLLTLGIHSTYRGFYYLRHALKLCLQDEDYLLFVYKRLYVDIAKEFRVSRDSVEHCMRTTITYCWNNGNRDFLCGIAKYPLLSKPTNSEFIDILYHHLKFQDR